jgi:hypothetical protein
MSFLKKIIATLTGMEQAPNHKEAGEKYRDQTEHELALERAREQQRRAQDQLREQQEVKVEVEEDSSRTI